jgi:phospholipid/cholesterol/gamma-HCH transport system permease protein
VIVSPKRLRWKAIVNLVESVGLDAAPIVMVLSFFIGAVIAYMGANLLASFGASVFMVDLVGFAVLRELAVIITAILLAGRSDSAFTASIGSMKMRQEIDAMTVMGLDTFEVLVIPRAMACIIAMPILTFLAMLSGLGGGLLVAWATADISPILFFNRLNTAVGIENLWVGLVKTPFFSLIIAVIGCRQGLAVTGSVESLGQRTTTSVVQAIFAVIFVNAMFAILFFQMGI